MSSFEVQFPPFFGCIHAVRQSAVHVCFFTIEVYAFNVCCAYVSVISIRFGGLFLAVIAVCLLVKAPSVVSTYDDCCNLSSLKNGFGGLFRRCFLQIKHNFEFTVRDFFK